jgi:hypothetical protein
MKVWELSKKIMGIGLVAMPLTFTGCLTDEGDDGDDDPPAAVDSTTVREATLGAQTNAAGSFLEADAFAVYKISEVTAALQSDIDLVFAFSETQTTASFYSPKAAADGVGGSQGFTFVKTTLGDNARDTEIRTISVTVYDGIKTKAGLDSAYAAASASAVANGRLAASENSAFIFQTSKGNNVAIKVDDLTNTATGSVDVSGKAKF